MLYHKGERGVKKRAIQVVVRKASNGGGAPFDDITQSGFEAAPKREAKAEG